MIIIETKTNVHIFKDREVDHVEYNRELSIVLLYFMAEGLLDEKKTVAFDDVLNVRYMTDACPEPYDFKSSEQARMLRELEERINLDTLNLKITRNMRGLYCLMKEGNSKARVFAKCLKNAIKSMTGLMKSGRKVITNNGKLL